MRKKTIKKYGMYRSGLEKTFAKEAPRGMFAYEPERIPYVVHRHYCPDFVHNETGIMIECKGFFRAGDTLKYKSIRDTIEAELVFVLSDPNKKLRKGAQMTMGQWCDKEGFKFFTVSQMEELIAYVSNS
jgi:hypothetical protein